MKLVRQGELKRKLDTNKLGVHTYNGCKGRCVC